MNFEDGLIYITKNYLNIKEVNNIFYSYCLLSDLCNETLKDKTKVTKFFQIFKEVNMFKYYLDKGTDAAKKIIKANYNKVEKIISKDGYKELTKITHKALIANSEFKKILNKLDTRYKIKEIPKYSKVYYDAKKNFYHIDQYCKHKTRNQILIPFYVYSDKDMKVCKYCYNHYINKLSKWTIFKAKLLHKT